MTKTNAIRLLEAGHVPHQTLTYEVDETDLSARHTSAVTGLSIDVLFKTLVLHGDKTGYFVCVIPGGMEVDLKKAARVSGNKNCEMIPMKELLPLTGYVRGGCSPIGMRKPFPTYIDETALLWDTIYCSGGARGLQIAIAPQALIDFVGMTVADLTQL